MTHHFSCVGMRHLAAGTENQDAFSVCSNDQYTVMVLADGVSACTHASQGAQLACETAAHLLLGCADYFMNAQQENITKVILRNILYALGRQADKENAQIEEFSSTLAFVLHDRKRQKLLLFQLGDGLIVGSCGERCSCLLQPGSSREGTCVTTTHGVESKCSVQFLDAAQYQSVMLLTDGAWRAFFSGGRIRRDVEKALACGKYHVLKNVLQQKPPMDDHSYLILTTA